MEEVIERGEVLVARVEGLDGGECRVGGGGWEGDLVLLGEAEEEFRGERAFEVHVVFCFGEGREEGVEGGFAHCGGWCLVCVLVMDSDRSVDGLSVRVNEFCGCCR